MSKDTNVPKAKEQPDKCPLISIQPADPDIQPPERVMETRREALEDEAFMDSLKAALARGHYNHRRHLSDVPLASIVNQRNDKVSKAAAWTVFFDKPDKVESAPVVLPEESEDILTTEGHAEKETNVEEPLAEECGVEELSKDVGYANEPDLALLQAAMESAAADPLTLHFNPALFARRLPFWPPNPQKETERISNLSSLFTEYDVQAAALFNAWLRTAEKRVQYGINVCHLVDYFEEAIVEQFH